MKLIAGLGNPGTGYINNRHNLGFMALDHLADKRDWVFRKRKNYEFVELKDHILIKPRTYMNRSGIAITSVMSSYPIEDILVVYDEASLPFGKIRFRHRGSSGGHNGIKSIKTALGPIDFKRFRIGIGEPENEIDLADYVLSNFSLKEKELLPDILSYSEKLLTVFIQEGFQALLEFHSKNKNPYSEKFSAFQDH